MADNVVFTQNEDGDTAVRVVSVGAGATEQNKSDVFTTDENGNAAIRVVGGGGAGGDQHNLGYYATLAELQESHPTGVAGDWAIVAESDTVYIWDDAQQAWVDTDRKGQVESVNGQTGVVRLTATDVDAIPQVANLPTASAAYENAIIQSRSDGYFYKCTSDGAGTYAWTRVDVLPIATSVDSTSTDAEVVSAKLFYDTCGDVESLINAL